MHRTIGVLLALTILLLAGACSTPAGYAPPPPPAPQDSGNGGAGGY